MPKVRFPGVLKGSGQKNGFSELLLVLTMVMNARAAIKFRWNKINYRLTDLMMKVAVTSTPIRFRQELLDREYLSMVVNDILFQNRGKYKDKSYLKRN